MTDIIIKYWKDLGLRNVYDLSIFLNDFNIFTVVDVSIWHQKIQFKSIHSDDYIIYSFHDLDKLDIISLSLTKK